ncbi:MAG: hypothetical protein JW841_07370 [Deltaproteobacteria bacterium]|nr:hypothetical protein [Deltaproteobacteria bacterium]
MSKTEPNSSFAAIMQKLPKKNRLRALVIDYGQLAIWVYLFIFLVVFIGFGVAIQLGFKIESVSATAGTWTAAYIATKLTSPLRIIATLAITPVIMKIRKRLKLSSSSIK